MCDDRRFPPAQRDCSPPEGGYSRAPGPSRRFGRAEEGERPAPFPPGVRKTATGFLRGAREEASVDAVAELSDLLPRRIRASPVRSRDRSRDRSRRQVHPQLLQLGAVDGIPRRVSSESAGGQTPADRGRQPQPRHSPRGEWTGGREDGARGDYGPPRAGAAQNRPHRPRDCPARRKDGIPHRSTRRLERWSGAQSSSELLRRRAPPEDRSGVSCAPACGNRSGCFPGRGTSGGRAIPPPSRRPCRTSCTRACDRSGGRA